MLGHFSGVVVDNATENTASTYWSLTSRMEWNWGLVWNALMRSSGVVVMGVLGNNFPQVALIQNQQMIQTFLANTSHPTLRHCIGLGRMKGCPDDFEALRNKNRVEGDRELGDTVMHEKAH